MNPSFDHIAFTDPKQSQQIRRTARAAIAGGIAVALVALAVATSLMLTSEDSSMAVSTALAAPALVGTASASPAADNPTVVQAGWMRSDQGQPEHYTPDEGQQPPTF